MTLFTALRSLIFMLAFYVGTAFFVLAAVIGGMFKPAHVQSAATGWSRSGAPISARARAMTGAS